MIGRVALGTSNQSAGEKRVTRFTSNKATTDERNQIGEVGAAERVPGEPDEKRNRPATGSSSAAVVELGEALFELFFGNEEVVGSVSWQIGKRRGRETGCRMQVEKLLNDVRRSSIKRRRLLSALDCFGEEAGFDETRDTSSCALELKLLLRIIWEFA